MSGGAARATFMLGALDVLIRERGFEPMGFAGVSAGALIAADLAQAPPGKLAERVREVVDVWLNDLPGRVRLGRHRHVVREIARERLDPDAIRSTGRRFVGGAVDVKSGRFVTITHKELKLEHLLGMSALPWIDPPVRIDDGYWVDGVLRRIVPLEAVLAERPAHVLLMTAGTPQLPAGRVGLWRMAQIAFQELVFTKEIRAALLASQHGGPRVEVLFPTADLPHPLAFDRTSLRRSFEHGQEIARSESWRWIHGPPPSAYRAYFD